MSLKLTFRIEMTSDYHVGAGYGKGTEIDSALLRDADGIPVLRGTVLNGLLRDGLWRLLQQEPLQAWQQCGGSGKEDTEERYCGQYTVGDVKLCPICRVFGTPRTMKRWRIGSARPMDREALAGTAYKTEDIASQRVMRVRVNPRTRRAAPHKLFSEEQGGQLKFAFTATCPADPAKDKMALDEAALLVAAARFVRQLGRSRRRGQGECLISLTAVEGADLGDNPQKRLLRRFEEHWLKGKPEALAQPQRSRLDQPCQKPSEGKSVRLWVLARADEPLLIAKRASAGNQFRSQPAITGKTLRGALAARAAERFDLDDHTTYDAFIALFLRGAVRFPTLYPLFRSRRGYFYPAAPVPRDGFTCKVYPEHPIQWGTREEERIEKCAECGNSVKGVRGEFFSLRALEPELFNLEQRSEMHIRVDPESGRVEEGQLFEYMALEAGQYFIGELICEDKGAWELLQELAGLEEKTPIPLRLGKATRRGYGQVTLWLEQWDDEKPPGWIQQPLGERVKGEEELTLTLLTDAIVTDPWGRFVTGFEDGWLSRELGFTVEAVEGHDFAAIHLVDGFNTKLRLPRWRDVALAAGSTVRLRIKETPKGGLLNALARIEREGIGLRKNEGYGQVAFNHPIHDDCVGLTQTRVGIPSKVDLAEREKTDESARTAFQRDWEKDLDDQPWGRCEKARFLGLARWLDTRCHEDIGELLKEMEALGEPDEQLIERIGGKKEYGDREIANPLTREEGFGLVKKLLKRLQEEDEAHRPLGVRMLADRLAEAAGGKEEGR
jgi:CRISPR-associated protein Csx10